MKFGPRIILYGRPEDIRFGALAEGCTTMGARAVFQRPGHFRASDAFPDATAVVVNGLGREGRPIRDTYAGFGIPTWIVELPRLRDEVGAHALLLNELQWLPDANGRSVVSIPKVKRTPASALVILQKPDDASHGMNTAALDAWARATVTLVREVTGLPVTIRPHPLSSAETPADLWGADCLSIPATESLRDAFVGAKVVVTYNSTVGWDAIGAGVPVVALGHAAYAPYASTLDRIEPLPAAFRRDALARAASTQWTLEELRNGRALAATVLSSTISHAA